MHQLLGWAWFAPLCCPLLSGPSWVIKSWVMPSTIISCTFGLSSDDKYWYILWCKIHKPDKNILKMLGYILIFKICMYLNESFCPLVHSPMPSATGAGFGQSLHLGILSRSPMWWQGWNLLSQLLAHTRVHKSRHLGMESCLESRHFNMGCVVLTGGLTPSPYVHH